MAVQYVTTTGNRLMAVQYVTTTQGTGCWQYSMSLPHREQADAGNRWQYSMSLPHREQVDGSTVCHYHTGNRLMAVQYVTTTQGTG